MRALNAKRVLSALGIVAMLTTPAFAQKRHHFVRGDQSAVHNAVPGYNESGVIPGYDENGGVVGIPNPDRYGIPSQR